MEKALKAKKIRITPFRTAVYSVFEMNENAISVNYIENQLQGFDRITLYRTLKLFKEKGIIHEITFPNKDKKLALCKASCTDKNDHNHEHIHLHCNKCKQVFCVEAPNYPKLKLEGYQIDKLEIQATGICNNCI